MNDNLPEPKIEALTDLEPASSSACTPAPKVDERRQLRRAKVRLRMRARAGEFDDGSFEEVASTLDASRKAFYFHTTSDRYRAGMRLRINFPYDPNSQCGEEDDIGEVVRVDKKASGYGVAVAFWKTGAAPTIAVRCEIGQQEIRGDKERRTQPRHPLVAAVELVDLPTGMRTSATTSDLSMGGCYVNTLNPFRLGATLGLKIEHASATVEVHANVCARFDGSGMCLAFEKDSSEQIAMLAEWLPTEDVVLADYMN